MGGSVATIAIRVGIALDKPDSSVLKQQQQTRYWPVNLFNAQCLFAMQSGLL